jgi:uracil-DNA glycosylase
MKHRTLPAFVQHVRAKQTLDRAVPDFDPQNGNERAKFLFVLEAPGPQAVETGFVSFENPDQTARNFRGQLEAAGINRHDIAIWNIVPWYVGAEDYKRIRAVGPSEVKLGTAYLLELLPLLPQLQCVVLVGSAARRAHLPLSAATSARILTCHHPSPRAQNVVSNAYAENVAVLKYMRESSQ